MINKENFDKLEFIPRSSSCSKLMGKRGLGKTGETYIFDYLSEKLKGKVDLVSTDALKPLIRPEVLDEAIYA